jgi:hypothetical protein
MVSPKQQHPMASSLVRFSILSVQNECLEVMVDIIHPDEWDINDKPNYALQIILEMYDHIQRELIYNAAWQFYPFTQEEAKRLLAEDLKPELAYLLELFRGKEIAISEEEYSQIQNLDNKIYQGQKIAGLGMSTGKYQVLLEREFDKYCEEAERYIENVEVIEIGNYPHWYNTLGTWLEYQTNWDLPDDVYEAQRDTPYPFYTLRIKVQ